MKTFKTIKDPALGTYSEKSSKFIAYLAPVLNKSEFTEHLHVIQKKEFKARHHCSAYIFGISREREEYTNDDGEPSGSAGLPILNCLRSNELTNIGAVVVRYFGGTKLGIPGLIRSYGNAVEAALSSTEIITRAILKLYSFECAYDKMPSILNYIKQHQLELLEKSFEDQAKFKIGLEENTLDLHLRELLAILRGTYVSNISGSVLLEAKEFEKLGYNF